jgi:hypothetical protein
MHSMTDASLSPNESEEASRKVVAEDLDKDLLDQLHAATLKASDSCFEIKKLCATVLIPTGTLVSVFAAKRLDLSVFVAGILVVALFWLADATSYFYQRRLRNRMSDIWERRAARCDEDWSANVPQRENIGPLRAAFNSSMIFYAIIASPIILVMILFWIGFIHSTTEAGTP